MAIFRLATIEHVLTASDIKNGFDVTFDKPADGTTQVVSANYVDAAGNAAIEPQPTDRAALDATAPTQTASVTAINDDTSPSVLPISANNTTYQGIIANGGVTNDTSLKISGSLSAAIATTDTVRIYDGKTYLGDATVSGTTWTFDDARILTDKQVVSYTAQVADTAGNQSAAGTPYLATLDTQIMNFASAELKSTLSNGINSLVSATFNHTTSEPGKFEIKAGNTLISSGVFDGTKLTVTSGISTAEAASVQLDFWDIAGNHSSYMLGNYKVDTGTQFIV